MIDEDEDEIACTFFGDAVDKFFNVIEEGKLYEFKRFSVSESN